MWLVDLAALADNTDFPSEFGLEARIHSNGAECPLGGAYFANLGLNWLNFLPCLAGLFPTIESSACWEEEEWALFTRRKTPTLAGMLH